MSVAKLKYNAKELTPITLTAVMTSFQSPKEVIPTLLYSVLTYPSRSFRTVEEEYDLLVVARMKHFEISDEENWDRWVTSDKIPVFVCKFAVYHESPS